ncbi:hypothetical protein LEP1GSC171_0417 [Leptospira santarosai str. HAI1380]|nr:hypothetical protein LEP1GSC039_3822 [Leptospira santarosai str. 2000027870]EMP01893.1 hypothetical protein LEP1GSC171_0417 [Leptospira santarosai str. HAI1380]
MSGGKIREVFLYHEVLYLQVKVTLAGTPTWRGFTEDVKSR